MALSKEAKSKSVEELEQLLSDSKLTVVAKYRGTPVKAMQQLRQQAKQSGTLVKVFKNRLVIQALNKSTKYKNVDSGLLTGMLVYAFNSHDEVASAQSLHQFSKEHPNLEFVGGISAEGKFLDSGTIKALATLPSKTQLLAGTILMLGAPLSSTISRLSNSLPAVIKGLEVKATN